jgi:starch synthase
MSVNLQVLSVASECHKLIKTGGLADVVGALPAAMAAEGVAMRPLIPGYPAVLAALDSAAPVMETELFGETARVLDASAGGLHLFVIDAPSLYARPGNPYTDASGRDWPDNAERFAALAMVAARLGQGALPGYQPDIIHAHDWQAGLAPAYLRYAGGPRPGTVMTIHNLAFQGQVPASLLGRLGLPPEAYALDGVEYYQSIGYLKAGLWAADRITTVSPTYAREICTEAGGMGISGLLAARASDVTGILNGIDTSVWDPAGDRLISASYSARKIERRVVNKRALRRHLGLVDDESLLFGVVSRLTWQKGMDLLLQALPTLLATGAQLAVLGEGDLELSDALMHAAKAAPGRIAVQLGYDEPVAHLMQAGCDALLVPSRFEPCGLTQLCALRYGALPVVSRVGGLADSVIDANEAALAAGVATGVQFAPVSVDMLSFAIRRCAALWQDAPTWARMQRNGMESEVGWSQSARRYAALYRGLAPASVAADMSNPAVAAPVKPAKSASKSKSRAKEGGKAGSAASAAKRAATSDKTEAQSSGDD